MQKNFMQKRDYVNIAITGVLFLLCVAFVVLVKTIDVGIAGFSGVEVGFSTINQNVFNNFRFHSLEVISDVLFILALAIMLAYAIVGLVQLIKHRSFKKVDYSLMCLAGTYVLMILIFVIFEVVPVNYRPIFVDGKTEPSFPSTHTMLAIVSFITAGIEISYLTKCEWLKPASFVLGVIFALVTTMTRLLSGVHWFTDIVGAVLIGAFLVEFYVTSLELVESLQNKPMLINAGGEEFETLEDKTGETFAKITKSEDETELPKRENNGAEQKAIKTKTPAKTEGQKAQTQSEQIAMDIDNFKSKNSAKLPEKATTSSGKSTKTANKPKQAKTSKKV